MPDELAERFLEAREERHARKPEHGVVQHAVGRASGRANGPQRRRGDRLHSRTVTPGRRHYIGAGEVPRVMSGLGISILSTSKGVMSGGSAKKQNLGGELLANVW